MGGDFLSTILSYDKSHDNIVDKRKEVYDLYC